jgi:hypothetical protein
MNVIDYICRDLRIGKHAAESALRDLELAGLIENLTPELPALKSSWRITSLTCQGLPPTFDHDRPEVVDRIKRKMAERKAAYRGGRK